MTRGDSKRLGPAGSDLPVGYEETPHGTSFLTPPPSGEPPLPFDEVVERVQAALPPDFPTDLSKVLVGLDVDGTLITARGASARVRRLYHELCEAGAHLVITTGRGRWATQPVLEELGQQRGVSACSNGAVLISWDLTETGRNTILATHEFIADEAIERVVRAIPDALLAVEVPEGYLVNRPFPVGELREDHWVVPYERLMGQSTTKLIVRAPRMGIQAFGRALNKSGACINHEVFVGWTAWADICIKGCTKANALSELSDIFGLPYSGTVAVGDGSNDIEMIRWARVGVAMGGASRHIKDEADVVTAAVENDGSAAVLQALLLHAEGSFSL